MAGTPIGIEGIARDATSGGGAIVDAAMPPGAISWTEYAATDVRRASEFLGGLFGWSARTKEFALEGAYFTWMLAGHDVAGMLAVSDLLSGCELGGWFPVIRVPNVDVLVARACELGASVLAEPSGLPGLGRHAMIAGPSNGRFALLDLLDAKTPRGPGCIGWTELRVSNPVPTALFLWQLFGWQAEAIRDHHDELVTIFRHGDHRVASMRRAQDGEPTRCLPCIQVGDADAASRRARDLGGAILEVRTDEPILGHTVRIVDPLGCELIVFDRR